jgi:uncharacterized protein (TIGR03083 family)
MTEGTMTMTDVWTTVHAERRALADDLRTINADQWATPSLCREWTVRDVLAHMTATAQITPASFFAKIAGAGFSFTRLQAKDIARTRGTSPADALAGFAAVIGSTSRPPGPVDTVLGETIVHAEDIRRPLGIEHTYPTHALVQVADFFKGSNLLLGTKRRITGLTMVATDTEWRHGAGPEVTGPILALLMAMTGRHAALAELSGDGVALMRSRA